MQEIVMVMPVFRGSIMGDTSHGQRVYPQACRDAQHFCCPASVGDRAETTILARAGDSQAARYIPLFSSRYMIEEFYCLILFVYVSSVLPHTVDNFTHFKHA